MLLNSISKNCLFVLWCKLKIANVYYITITHSLLKSKFYFYFFLVQEYWWAVILIAIGLILFMGLFITVCYVTLRRRRSQPRQQQRNPRHSEPLQQSLVCIVMGWMCIRHGGWCSLHYRLLQHAFYSRVAFWSLFYIVI